MWVRFCNLDQKTNIEPTRPLLALNIHLARRWPSFKKEITHVQILHLVVPISADNDFLRGVSLHGVSLGVRLPGIISIGYCS